MQSLKSYSRKKKIDPEPDYPDLPVRTRKPVDDEVERKHFQKVVNSFRHYRYLQKLITSPYYACKLLIFSRLVQTKSNRNRLLSQNMYSVGQRRLNDKN